MKGPTILGVYGDHHLDTYEMNLYDQCTDTECKDVQVLPTEMFSPESSSLIQH